MSSIELRGVTYRYPLGGVSDVSFTLAEGQVACLLGPSGSGKTTLLRLISGFLSPQQGSVLIGGEDMRNVPPQRRHVGLVFQQHALFPHMTVAGNILFGVSGKSKAERTALLDKLLADFAIGQHRDRYPHQISGGEQQRVALARAIASQPRLLLMDEPFSSLDSTLRGHVRGQCLDIIRANRLTTLIVTHDEDEARLITDQLIRI